ncbi:hypothetical protein ACI79G_13855 [Geodermatophilus sp. SYSU D00779]
MLLLHGQMMPVAYAASTVLLLLRHGLGRRDGRGDAVRPSEREAVRA